MGASQPAGSAERDSGGADGSAQAVLSEARGEPMAGRVLLNLGCGDKLYPGWVNVDAERNWSGKRPDVVADISKPLPFPDGYADEVHGYHVIEHFHRWEAEDIVRDWVRVLKPGGILALECPCLEKVMGIMLKASQEKVNVPSRLTLWAMYGDPNYKDPAMSHRWLYSKVELGSVMHKAGVREITVKQPLTHIPERDMRIIGRKP